MANFYQILNVDPRAPKEVIEAAFKVLAHRHHPDHGGNAKVYGDLVSARAVLTDDAKRKAYDNRKDPTKGTMVGPYEVLKFIAEGAMGRTYIARHKLTGQLVCLKACLAVSPEYEAVMLNEAGAIWDIRHYAFPAVRDVFKQEDGSIVIAMSYIPGPTLEQAVKHLGTIEPEHVGWIFERLLAGLNYLHANGVVHGDIKPQNVILQPDRHGAVLIDFGLAMVKPSATDANIGFTEGFAPPEQIGERKPLIPETDLYSLGMTMLYALTGKVPLRGATLPKTIPTAMRDFIRGLIAPDVFDRPNWQKTDILAKIADVRMQSFGTRNTRGKAFPKVPYDTVTA